jgi:hypothetical protein
MKPMQHKIKLLIFLSVVCFAICTNCFSQNQSYFLAPTKNVDELKRKCIDAAIRGILLDKKRLMNWINNYDETSLTDGAISIEEMRNKLANLEAELAKYENITLESYQLPEKKDLVAWIAYEKGNEDTQIYFEHQSRSGPFYHITGINGNDYEIIESNTDLWEPKNKYLMEIYLAYPRYYPFPNYYIYIDSLKKVNKSP